MCTILEIGAVLTTDNCYRLYTNLALLINEITILIPSVLVLVQIVIVVKIKERLTKITHKHFSNF